MRNFRGVEDWVEGVVCDEEDDAGSQRMTDAAQRSQGVMTYGVTMRPLPVRNGSRRVRQRILSWSIGNPIYNISVLHTTFDFWKPPHLFKRFSSLLDQLSPVATTLQVAFERRHATYSRRFSIHIALFMLAARQRGIRGV